MTHFASALEGRPDDMTRPDGSSAPLLPSDSQCLARSVFLRDVLAGLGATPKQLSPKYFYDREGSVLFDAICELPEYYVTRTELSILASCVNDIAARISNARTSRARGDSKGVGELLPPCRVVEPGAGSGTKTRLLLDALGPHRCVEYVPVDISDEHLHRTAARLRGELPWLRVRAFAGVFSLCLPPQEADTESRTLVYFPGSTIGNFDPPDAQRLLARFRRAAGPEGLVLLGVDLKKDPTLLHAAYNDACGVTAAFNKNVLRRINAEIGADFDVDSFYHYAFYEPISGRIEMHLVSARRQSVHVGGLTFTFGEGESLCTERSYKYDLPTAERLGRAAGLSLLDGWLDESRQFAVLLFQSADLRS